MSNLLFLTKMIVQTVLLLLLATLARVGFVRCCWLGTGILHS